MKIIHLYIDNDYGLIKIKKVVLDTAKDEKSLY